MDLIQICNAGAIPTYIFYEVDMSWVEHLRAELLKRGHKTTVTAILIKAIAIAQIKHPDSRKAWLPWGQSITLNEIVAGFTVEKFIDGQPAVYLGTIKDPINKSVEQIAAELKNYASLEADAIPQLATQHRFAKMPWLLRRLILWLGLMLPAIRLRYMPASFGLSSLGKYAIRSLIPPCVSTSTFGVGAVENRPVVRGGEVVIRPMLSITLNFDHRLIDGAPAARFLNEVRLLLEGGLAEYLDVEEFKPVEHIKVDANSAASMINTLDSIVLTKQRQL